MGSICGIFSSNVHLLKACWEVAEVIIMADLIETVDEWYFKLVSSCNSSITIKVRMILLEYIELVQPTIVG